MKTLLILGMFAGFANAQVVGQTVKSLPAVSGDTGTWKATAPDRFVVVQQTDAVLPFLSNGEGLRSVIRMVNLEAAAADYMIDFMQSDGQAMAFPLVGHQAVSALRGAIPPNGVLELVSTGKGATMTGWGLALSTSARISTAVSLQERGVDGEWRSSTHHAANASVKRMRATFDNTEAARTWVAFCNVNTTGPTPLTIIVRDTMGEELARGNYTMAGSGQYRVDIAEMAARAAGIAGTVDFEIPNWSALGLGGVSVRLTAGGFDLLDTMAITDWAN